MSSSVYRELPDGSRASYGGDEFLFVEICEEMSLQTAFRVQTITGRIRRSWFPGIVDVAPANTSYLLHLDPDVVAPAAVMDALTELHDDGGGADGVITTRIVEIPVHYDDPWTREVCLRFRAGHQSATGTDLEYTAQVNGFSDPAGLIAAHTVAPFIVTFPCFKPGNAESFQLVPRDRQLQAPKYLSPRTETPERAVAHGGCFTVVYPTGGVGGYQLLGRAAIPVVDLTGSQPGFEDSVVLTPISTLIQFRAVDRPEYDDIRERVAAGAYAVAEHPVDFSLPAFTEDPAGYARTLKELLR
ncbi:5-oxoprolinase subunit B family protein [Amycolatopsis jejuensis]|uniref:5-oxoprolinase subunit B family protein n=1 Tax=Amycolatopsis jejuensis TaxID=330084 RepID=UPI000527BFD0|nr:carboxyltransferase domain-containing protein [Amycolatopsis jejuensis]